MVQLASEAVAQTRAVKLIVLDRDGVINRDSDQFIKSPDEWRPIPGSLEAIARLNHAGFRVVVATNQSGIGRGLFDMATLNGSTRRCTRRWRWPAAASTRCSTARTPPIRTASAGSRNPACCGRSACGSASR